MLNIFKNAFSKKLRQDSQTIQFEQFDQFQLEEPQVDNKVPIDFQIIDEEAMKIIEEEYDNKQQVQSVHQEEQQFQEDLIDYEVKPDDSLYGMAIKFNVCEDYLMRINNLSSDLIFQGQFIRIPKKNEKTFPVVHIQEEREKLEYLWNPEANSLRFDVVYCNNIQNVQGQLTLASDLILFNPVQQDHLVDNHQKLRFQACISMSDINEAVYYVLPNKYGHLDYIVQIMLSGIGKPKFEKKHRKQLDKLKEQKQSIATVFFRHAERDYEGKLYAEEIKKENCITMARFITEACSTYTAAVELTLLPFVDFIYDLAQKQNLNVDVDEISDVIGQRMGNLWASLEYVPILTGNSNCFTNTTFKQVIQSIPAIYRLANWNKLYDIDIDGSSYHNMLQQIRQIFPMLLIIKDFDLNIFGVYISSEINKYFQGFKGNGETFLFNVDSKNEIRTFVWTEKNKDFIFCDESGIGIGCGDKFGLFIDQSLSFGYSNPCSTFENPRFTNEEKFGIMHMELWAIEQQ
ncbi:unnamed protein product (macronuclear) [Paramecium tetraurelia]|uniref:Oxidation resistance protein 1 n=1 Tax=Paramecium tetraurelia TaxID=5888 RepID=A0C4E0_PARTE|nr:uncharacterized protein GSPATT00035137001 [Paramecium tetraurelia]CAK65657.1 unnamed protein product [Paramecium tetraurelia]|eukprot:XP_001433054.1 hypothetical protein (macronuclear) [Paramecium tetraurelia strain d4-2]